MNSPSTTPSESSISKVNKRAEGTVFPRMLRHGENGLVHEYNPASCTGCQCPHRLAHGDIPPCTEWQGNEYTYDGGWEHHVQLSLYGECPWCGAEVL